MLSFQLIEQLLKLVPCAQIVHKNSIIQSALKLAYERKGAT
jgi:hypothetical protein